MEVTYKNKAYTLGKKDRNIEGEAPAVRVKMVDNETKVIGLMAPSVQVMITLNDVNKYNSDLHEVITTTKRKVNAYIKPWFIKSATIANNLFGVYVSPIEWVNRHRLHHKYSDHDGDPSKHAEDGFWRTLYLCLFPYPCTENLAKDDILKSRVFLLCSSTWFLAASQILNFALLWYIVGDMKFAAALWIGLRIFALWVNMIQNYWTHTREFGYRRYHDENDNAMNIGEWLPVTATFSACLQNNHHHHPSLLRLSHSDAEYDFGFLTIKLMKSLGLVEATRKGMRVPKDVPLSSLGL